MCEETANPAPFVWQQELSSCDSVLSPSRGHAVKGLIGALAGSLLFHALVAATVVLLAFILPQRKVHKPYWTVSLVDNAEVGGNPGAIGTAGSGRAGQRPSGPSPAARDAKDSKTKDSSAIDALKTPRGLDLPDWPVEKSTKSSHTVARSAAKVLVAAGVRHLGKHNLSHKHPVAPLKAAPLSSVQPGSEDMATVVGEAKGYKPGNVVGTGKGAVAGEGEGTGGPALGGRPSEAGSSWVAHRVYSVDKPPEPLRKYEPVYPDRARELGISGKVVVKFLVGPHGHVSRPVILQAHPKGFFEQSALDAILRWRFKPGCFRGKPVGAWVILPFQFQLTRQAVNHAVNG